MAPYLESQCHDEPAENDSQSHDLDRRHSGSPDAHGHTRHDRPRTLSMTARMDFLREAGGVNSINNFARSWQRATAFHEVAPTRPSFRFCPDGEGEGGFDRQDVEWSPDTHRSLLRQALENDQRRSSDNAIADDDDAATEQTPLFRRGTHSTADSAAGRRKHDQESPHRHEPVFMIEPSLASAFGGSYGTSYGSLRSHIHESPMRHAGRPFAQQQISEAADPDKEREPLLVKRVEEEGEIIHVVVGRSTMPQTVVNSINVLIGVGLLSIPLAFKYSGWLIGMLFFLFAAVTTAYTAKLLAKCLDVDNSLITFADLAYVSFGSRARVATSVLFSVELLAMCVALVILFADSLNALFPGWSILGWKVICGLILLPLVLLPLRLLSVTSVLGVLSCFGIVVAVFLDGLTKPHQPGSLREPAPTFLVPSNWATVPLSFGLFMAPWGGHSISPSIYKDMRHPKKFRRSVDIAYSFAYPLDLFVGVVGLLMFGDSICDEVTVNIFRTPGYPRIISVFIVICVAVIPLTKIPLNARPIISTIDILCGVDAHSAAHSNGAHMSDFKRGLLIFGIRVFTVATFVGLAVLVPDFDRIMSIMGSVACFTICIILPLAFHLKLFSSEMSGVERYMNWILLSLCSVMAVVSTIFACLPRDVLGA